MRSAVAAAAALVSGLLLAACGGSTITIGNSDGGGSTDGGPAPGADGGRACTPLPGCSSTTSCPAGDGCNTCTCLDGAWGCTLLGCPGDSGPFVCPTTLPPPNSVCPVEGQRCTIGTGCAPTCTCTHGAWQCIEPPCPPPICPPSAPQNATACSAIGEKCAYPLNGACSEYDCTCWPSGSWGCSAVGCPDGGASDGGQAMGCLATGGTETKNECCLSTGDFPDTCAIGACSCPPSASHTVVACDCGAGRCFNGFACVTR
jgi:hypothetical protein